MVCNIVLIFQSIAPCPGTSIPRYIYITNNLFYGHLKVETFHITVSNYSKQVPSKTSLKCINLYIKLKTITNYKFSLHTVIPLKILVKRSQLI